MKRKFYLIIALAVALILSGTYAYAYTYTSAGVMGGAVTARDIATCERAPEENQPDWDSILIPVGDTEILRPSAAGTYSQCDPVGDSPNYACVDEAVADEDATYVQTWGGATELDTYNIADHSEGSGTIDSVTIYIRTSVTEGTHAAEVAIRTYGTNYFDSYTSPVPTSYTNISATWTENPYTGSAWTWAEIDALEIGVRHYDLGTGYLMTTQVYAEVSYGYIPLTGSVPTGDLFNITPGAYYTGDLQVAVYLTNTGALIKAYRYLNMKLYLEGSVEAEETPNYRLLTLQNGQVVFTMQDLQLQPISGTWTQTSQYDFEAGTLYQVDVISPGDVILDTFSDNVTDTFDNEDKIAYKSNLVVTDGQVKLTGSSGGTETLRPNAAGTYSQCDPIGDSPNYQCVDEAVADEDSTYVRTWYGATELDTYNIADHSEGIGGINSVTVYIRTRVTSGTHAAEVAIRTYGTNYFDSYTSPVPTSYTNISATWTENPYTGSAWTWAEIDALEIGVRHYDLNGGYNMTTQVYAEVDYTVYDSPGTLTSTNLLSGEKVISIDSFGYNASAIPSGTGLKVQFSQDNTNWYNSAGTAGGWDTLSQGTHTIDLSGLGWSGANFYYNMEFTSDGTDTPVLDEITVNFSSYYTSGTLTSSAYDTGYQDDCDWGTISFTIDEPSGTDIKFQIRTAATEGGLSAATWYGPTPIDDYYTTSGTNINSVHDGDRWIQYKAYFSGPGDSTPTLSDVTITYAVTGVYYTVEVIGGSYCLVSDDTSEWGDGWTVTPQLYCEVTQK